MFLLLKANHKDGSFHIGTQVVEVKRGQLVTSQKKLCKQFNWSNSKLRNYLKTAKNASMIHTETTSKKTPLTILNYDSYQDVSTEKAFKKHQISTKEAPKKHTNKNNKELKNNKTLYDSDNNRGSIAVLDFGGDFTVSGGTFKIVFPAATASNAIVRID